MDMYFTAVVWFIAFAVFHSFTAHEIFKDMLTKVFGAFFVEHYWRLIYCLVSYGMFYYGFVADILVYENYALVVNYPEWLWNTMAVLKLAGMVISYWAYVQFDYFEFWGVRQALRGIKNWRTKAAWQPMKLAGVQRLEVRGIYHFCRHPMLFGGLLFIGATAPIRATLVYTAMYFIYMIIGAYFEEKRLITHFSGQYLEYRKEVGAFLPNLRQIRRWVGLAPVAVAE